jgi:hypothetical protein
VSAPGRKPKHSQGRGELRADALYPVAVFMRRLGIGRHSLTALRRQGLPIRNIGQRCYIDGSEALTALRRIWRTDQGAGDARIPEVIDQTGQGDNQGT